MKRPILFILLIYALILTGCSGLFPRHDSDWEVTFAIRRDVFEQYYKMDNMEIEYIDGWQYVVFTQETGLVPFGRLPNTLNKIKIDNLWDYNMPVFQLVEIEENYKGVYEECYVRIVTSEFIPPEDVMGNAFKLRITARIPGRITNHKRADGGELIYTFNDLSTANELKIRSRVFDTSLAAGYGFVILIFVLLLVFLLVQGLKKFNSMISVEEDW